MKDENRENNGGYLGLILMIICTVLAIIVVICSNKECFATEQVIFEPIPVAEMMNHEEEIAYQKWLEANEPNYLIDVTEEEIDLMANVVMREASILNNDGKQLTASTLVYRVMDGRWGDTVSEVIYYPNAYCTEFKEEPTKACYEAVYAALTYDAFPHDLFYFRSGKPHSFGEVYAHEGNTYFSTETDSWKGGSNAY